MVIITNPVVPKGSSVLITGVNSFVGSHIVDQFLRNGYKVRGTVRNPSKVAWAVETFSNLYGKDNFELVAVPDIAVDGAFDEVVKGEFSATQCKMAGLASSGMLMLYLLH